jgi:hypothetical protein
MPIRGEEIDISRPLKMVNGTKINRIEKAPGSYFPIHAFYFEGDKELTNSYTSDGFFVSCNYPSYSDLIYADDMPTQDLLIEAKKRKVVQVTVLDHPLGHTIYAVTDDGLIFRGYAGSSATPNNWEKLSEIPQD